MSVEIEEILRRLDSIERTNRLLVRVSRAELAMYVALEQIASADRDAVSHSAVATEMRDQAQRAIAEISGDARHYLGFIAAFARQMESLLYTHDAAKGRFGWRECEPLELLPKLREEITELIAAVGGGDPEEIAREAADAANICAMIADAAGGVTK